MQFLPPAVRVENRIRAVRPALVKAGYTAPAVAALLQTERYSTNREEDGIVFERRLAGDSASAIAARLVHLNLDVDQVLWDRALPELPAVALEELGLATVKGGVLRAKVRLVPHGDIFIACDPGSQSESPDHVTGVTNPAGVLADLAIRRPARLGLDLGCGCGIQALLMARHCERVIATDLNPRALEFTRLNAAINGVDNVECRLGSFFEPIAGLEFDLLLCNPPYVISPDNQFLFRDSGLPADSLCRRLVGEAGLHLAEGGFAQMLISWAQLKDRPWDEIVAEWVAGAPCDAWFLHYSTEDPLTHAAKWNQPFRMADVAGFPAALDRWTAYYREQGIDQIGFGAVILRRRSDGDNWVRSDKLRVGLGPAGDQVLRVFSAEDLLRGAGGDKALLATPLRLAGGHRLETTLVQGSAGGWEQVEVRLIMTTGLGFQGTLDLPVAQFLAHLDGEKTVAEAATTAANESGLPSAELGRYRQSALQAVRSLLELGFLEAS